MAASSAAVGCALIGLMMSTSVMAAGNTGGHHGNTARWSQLLRPLEKTAVASVDGDPDFIVGVQGLEQPLCFRVEGEAGQVVRLLQDPDSGVVVNARISRPVAGSHKTYLSAVLISRRNFRVVVKVGRVLVNRYVFDWGPVSVRLVHGHRVLIAPTLMALTLRNKNVTLVVKRHLPEGRRLFNDTVDNSTTTTNSSAPNTATGTAYGPGIRQQGSVTSRHSRRRGSGRRVDVDRGPRRRNRRNQRRRSGGRRRLGGARRTLRRDRDRSRDRNKRDVISKSWGNKNWFALTPREKMTGHGMASRARRSVDASLNDDEASDIDDDHLDEDDDTSGGVAPRELAAYVGFYVADARDLSTETHGLLGQFLHKAVTLQRVRQKTNGRMKARLLVERPRQRHVKATLRTRTNMALNTSSSCWWLRDGGVGVVDGMYDNYLVSRFRATELLPLPPGLMGQ